jgi:hypothetical protein
VAVCVIVGTVSVWVPCGVWRCPSHASRPGRGGESLLLPVSRVQCGGEWRGAGARCPSSDKLNRMLSVLREVTDPVPCPVLGSLSRAGATQVAERECPRESQSHNRSKERASRTVQTRYRRADTIRPVPCLIRQQGGHGPTASPALMHSSRLHVERTTQIELAYRHSSRSRSCVALAPAFHAAPLHIVAPSHIPSRGAGGTPTADRQASRLGVAAE